CGLLTVPIGTVPNARLPGATPMTGATPVPVSATVSGLDAALLEIVRAPDRLPVAVGENVTLMTQPWPAGTGCAAHAEACAPKSPLAATASTVRLVVPELVTVIGLVWLVVPTACWPKSRLAADRLTAAFVPVPVSGSVCVPSTEEFVTTRLAVRSPAA